MIIVPHHAHAYLCGCGVWVWFTFSVQQLREETTKRPVGSQETSVTLVCSCLCISVKSAVSMKSSTPSILKYNSVYVLWYISLHTIKILQKWSLRNAFKCTSCQQPITYNIDYRVILSNNSPLQSSENHKLASWRPKYVICHLLLESL